MQKLARVASTWQGERVGSQEGGGGGGYKWHHLEMVKQMRIKISRKLSGFYDVFAGDGGADGHTGDDNFLIYSQ